MFILSYSHKLQVVNGECSLIVENIFSCSSTFHHRFIYETSVYHYFHHELIKLFDLKFFVILLYLVFKLPMC